MKVRVVPEPPVGVAVVVPVVTPVGVTVRVSVEVETGVTVEVGPPVGVLVTVGVGPADPPVWITSSGRLEVASRLLKLRAVLVVVVKARS